MQIDEISSGASSRAQHAVEVNESQVVAQKTAKDETANTVQGIRTARSEVNVQLSAQSLQASRLDAEHRSTQRDVLELQGVRMLAQHLTGRNINLVQSPARADAAPASMEEQAIFHSSLYPVSGKGIVQLIPSDGAYPSTGFRVQGFVVSQSGNSINVDFEIQLENSFIIEQKILEIRNAKDPLVMNFNNGRIEFEDESEPGDAVELLPPEASGKDLEVWLEPTSHWARNDLKGAEAQGPTLQVGQITAKSLMRNEPDDLQERINSYNLMINDE